MNERSYNSRFAVEALEARSMMAAVAYADFNNDGRVDVAAVTSATTITVSLAQADGTFKVSAILNAPKSLPVNGVAVSDVNADGKLDITTGGVSDRFYSHTWLGNGDGTFGTRDTLRGSRIHPGAFF
jgi:hypothetical protein